MSSSNCCFLTCIQISEEVRSGGQVFPCLRIFQSLLWATSFGIVNKAEVDVFLKHSCFFNDPTDVGNLISGSSVNPVWTSGSSRFTVHVLLKPCLENFEHYFASMWDECNCAVVWAFFGIAFGDWNEVSITLIPKADKDFTRKLQTSDTGDWCKNPQENIRKLNLKTYKKDYKP